MMKQRRISPKPSGAGSSSGSSRSVSTASAAAAAAAKPSANRVRSLSVATRRPTPPVSSGSSGHGAGAGGRLVDDAVDDDLYRVRSFTTKTGALVNRGDSFKRRGPKLDRGGGGGEDASLPPPSCPPPTGGVFRSPPPPSHPPSSLPPLPTSSSSPSGRTTDTGAAAAAATPQETIPLGTGKIVCQFSTATDADSEVRKEEEESASTAPSSVEPSGRRGPGAHRPATGGAASRKGRWASTGNAYGDEDSDVPPVYKVLVLGSQGVGKTTLTRQLLSSEYYSSDCANAADDRDDETVTVMLDEEESVIQLIDSQGLDMGKNTLTHSEGRFDARLGSRDFGKAAFAGDGFLVVYSVTDRSSFVFAQSCLQELRPAKRHNAVILVANKHDLVRNRLVPETEGIKLATKRQCKFIEVSALLDHRLDELLVGIVRQIRLRQTTAGGIRSESTSSEGGGRRGRTGNRLSDTIGAFLQKVFRRDRTTGGKCEDLLVP